jgi:hypothetical protein
VNHGIDVVEDFVGSDVRWHLSECPDNLSVQQTSRSNNKPFDPRGGDGFGSQQDTSKRLGIDECARVCVLPGDGSLGVSDVGSNL